MSPTIDEYIATLNRQNEDQAATLDAFAAEHGGGTTEPPEPPGPHELVFTFPNHTITAPGVIARHQVTFTGRIVEASLIFDFWPGPFRSDRPDGQHGVAQLAGAGKWDQECLFWHWYIKNANDCTSRYKAPALVGRELSRDVRLSLPETKVYYDLLRQPDGTYSGVLNGSTLTGPLTVHPKSPLTLQLGTVDNPPPQKEVSWVGSTFSNIRLVLALEE